MPTLSPLLLCLAALAVAAPAGACEAAPPATPDLPAVFASVSLADGVDDSEALRIANAYALTHLSGCGGVPAVTDTGTTWTATPYLGFAAEPGAPIVIDAKTGTITCADGPTVAAPAGAAASPEAPPR